MKKRKTFLVLAVSAMLMAGCTSGSDTSKGKVEEGIEERDITFSKELGEGFLKVNMDYYNYCKEEYKGKVKTGPEGVLVADNGNGVEIFSTKIKGKDEILDLGLYSSGENRGKLLDEINNVLKMNNYENMTQEEFDGAAWTVLSKDTIIWDEGEENISKGSMVLYKIEEGSYIEKGELVLEFFDGLKENNKYRVIFHNKDSFLKMKELSDKAFAERDLEAETAE